MSPSSYFVVAVAVIVAVVAAAVVEAVAVVAVAVVEVFVGNPIQGLLQSAAVAAAAAAVVMGLREFEGEMGMRFVGCQLKGKERCLKERAPTTAYLYDTKRVILSTSTPSLPTQKTTNDETV
ncbi:hypothetical protein F0562_022795 [Nyssa sinensis]|uniref:Uncharacterized protein n=1 Tax=Nyssa sinensis TaxID=561372 RepID=A0A5J5BET2_9ASTE|nr:hypothetical protein F0562_022795 [Nyssa sinensis]